MKQWDSLPVLGVGATGHVRRDGDWVVKLAHPLPEARARLLEEVRLHRRLQRAGLPVPALGSFSRRGRFLRRRFVAGRALLAEESASVLEALWALRQRLLELETRWSVRFDFTPPNLVWTRGGVVLLDGGPRLAPPRFRSTTLRGFTREWAHAVTHPLRPRLQAPWLPPSGRFHVEVPLGVDASARVLWRNQPLLARLGLPWSEAHLLELGALDTEAPPTTTRPASRYTDMVQLDLRRGPKGDGRAVALGRIETRAGKKDLMAKGVGPTPLAWRGRAFHHDGRVSLPRTLWEVTVADELARLGFETPEYLGVLSTKATTVDNTERRWPAAIGLRASSTHWRVGHLRAVAHDAERFGALLRHVWPSAVRRHLATFISNFGFDVGKADALHIHCFNVTPGNVRLDGHFIDYSTVRFMRHFLPQFRFLEGKWTIGRTRAVSSQVVLLLVDVLLQGGALEPTQRVALRTWALRRFLAACKQGALAGYARVFGFSPEAMTGGDGRRLVAAMSRLRGFRSTETVRFTFFKQRCLAPRFDVLGRASAFVRAIEREAPEPWRAMLAPGTELTALERRAAERATECIRLARRNAQRPARSWNEVIRPWLEPEGLAAQLYRRAPTRRWAERMARSTSLREGTYSYLEAHTEAARLGHLELDTLAGTRERIVGLSEALAAAMRRVLRRVLGTSLVGVVLHGSRVMERRELKRRVPLAFTQGDLRLKAHAGVREYGPSRGASSDLDLKVFVVGLDAAQRLRLGRALAVGFAGLDAWFPIGSWPRQRLISTRHRDVVRAFRAWNGSRRFQETGKLPIPELQAAVFPLR